LGIISNSIFKKKFGSFFLNFIKIKSYIVDEAKFVSSCFNFPSNAKPLLSLLFAKSGINEYTFVKFEHGVMGKPSLKIKKYFIKSQILFFCKVFLNKYQAYSVSNSATVHL
jgi:hypothetical protein